MTTQYDTQKSILEKSNDLPKLLEVLLDKLSMIDIVKVSIDFIKSKLVIPGLGTQEFGYFILYDTIHSDEIVYSDLAEGINQQLITGSFSKLYVVSNRYISKGVKEKLHKNLNTNLLDYWDRDELIKKINDLYPDYWRHGDQELLAYERIYSSDIHDDWSFGRIKQFKATYDKLYDIFIEPKIFHKVRDKEALNHVFIPTSIDKIKNVVQPIIIEGESGSGKTRLIRELGHIYIKENPNTHGKKFLPVFISITKLIDTKEVSSEIRLTTAIISKLQPSYANTSLEDIISKYTLVLLLDSIDDLDDDSQKKVLIEIVGLSKQGARVIMGTRNNTTAIPGIDALEKREEYVISKFNIKQVKQFLTRYFSSNSDHADDLIQSIQENKILERLPITPLNLSLISILYEENNFEIPATITDIYDNFNNLLLGRATADSRLQFFDINMKERILSRYALELLKRDGGKSMTKDEFSTFFTKFFQPISGTVKLDLLPHLFDHLINGTGLLTVEEDKYIKFRHDSYLEYYASREIFYFEREDENKLIENFLDISWQYTAIFFAGRTKDSATFLRNVIARAAKASTAADAWKGIAGLGYITQALYLTTNTVRKEAVSVALDLTVLLQYGMKILGANDAAYFKNLTIPLVTIISSMLFMDSFSSITVKSPLNLVFEELFQRFVLDENAEKESDKLSDELRNNYAFKLFSLALAMSNKRLDDSSKMQKLIFETNLLRDPLYETLLTFGTEVANSKALHSLKDDALKPKRSSKEQRAFYIPNSIVDIIAKKPAGQLRFTEYDRINPIRNIRIFTEGKTDAQIIEHAYTVLTGQLPYWDIKQVGMKDGTGAGAHPLSVMLKASYNLLSSNDEMVIGIFDNDDKGCQEFKGFNDEFPSWKNSLRVKKHKNFNIYAMKLPVPPEQEVYIQEDQRYNLFSIEHYFSEELLAEHKMIETSPISGTFKINSNRKAKFAKTIIKNDSKEIFKKFLHLFQQIDAITGINDIEYDL